MSNLKNTYGFSSSLLDAIRSVHETTHKEEVELDEADHTYPFKANQLAPLVVQLRSLLNFLSKSGALKKSMREHAELVEAYIGEEITEEQLEEMISFVDDLMEGRPKGRLLYGYQHMNKPKVAAPAAKPVKKSDEDDEEDEVLSKSGALKKSMREHAELVEAYIGEEITEEQLEKMISFVDDLMEGRPKGSKNKSKMASAPKPAARTGKDEDEEDEEQQDVYKPASRDGRHILPELSNAADDKKGTAVQTSSGQRHVPQHVAAKMVKHLMSLKPIERAEHSTHIFNGSVPKVKTLNHIKTNVLIKQMGSEKKIGSDASVKRGRGRPKKAV